MAPLLLIDDQQQRRWTERVLSEGGYLCDGVGDAETALERLTLIRYKLVLLDLSVAGESGMRLLARIRSRHPTCAVLMLSAVDSVELAISAIELGAYGYLLKPLDARALLINVATALHRRRRELESRKLLDNLETTVADRNVELQGALDDLCASQSELSASQAETIFRLARLVEFRDLDTGQHLQRMSAYCGLLAGAIGLRAERCELIRRASQLHDLGKVAIPDSVLLKPGKLTDAEFEIMKGHAEAGYRMLAGSSSEVVRVAAAVARCHHEHYDGGGYPRGLAGREIPLEGRIAAIADVFDALTNDRVYRSAYPLERAVAMMRAERGSHFDPDLLEAFVASLPEVEAIRRAPGVPAADRAGDAAGLRG